MRRADPALPGGHPAEPPDGVLVVDKPEGPTSHDVVARARRALHVRQIGHTGTLDPMATGVLALVVGRATRLAQFLSAGEKTYEAGIRLGIETDSWDRTGTVVAESTGPLAGLREVEAAVAASVGERDQAPPPFSAKKIAGVRAYRLARRGLPAEPVAARVTLRRAAIERFEPPLLHLRVTCSAGFYVRALAHELGLRLGCGGCLDSLRRTGSGSFTLAHAVPLAALEESPGSAIARMVPMDFALPDLASVVLTPAAVERALHGNDVGPGDWTAVIRPDEGPESARERRDGAAPPGAPAFTGFTRLLSPEGRLLAVARPAGGRGILHPAVVLG